MTLRNQRLSFSLADFAILQCQRELIRGREHNAAERCSLANSV
jgi:hypothetical protein